MLKLNQFKFEVEIRENIYELALRDLKVIRKRRIRKLPKIPMYERSGHKDKSQVMDETSQS
jgi:hypothetical protein